MIKLLDSDTKPIAEFESRAKLWKYLMDSLPTEEFIMLYFDTDFDAICRIESRGTIPIFYVDFDAS